MSVRNEHTSERQPGLPCGDSVTAELTVRSDPPSCWGYRMTTLVSLKQHPQALSARQQGRCPSLKELYLQTLLCVLKASKYEGRFTTTRQIQGQDQRCRACELYSGRTIGAAPQGTRHAGWTGGKRDYNHLVARDHHQSTSYNFL